MQTRQIQQMGVGGGIDGFLIDDAFIASRQIRVLDGSRHSRLLLHTFGYHLNLIFLIYLEVDFPLAIFHVLDDAQYFPTRSFWTFKIREKGIRSSLKTGPVASAFTRNDGDYGGVGRPTSRGQVGRQAGPAVKRRSPHRAELAP
jgi:hypothetical protein